MSNHLQVFPTEQRLRQVSHWLNRTGRTVKFFLSSKFDFFNFIHVVYNENKVSKSELFPLLTPILGSIKPLNCIPWKYTKELDSNCGFRGSLTETENVYFLTCKSRLRQVPGDYNEECTHWKSFQPRGALEVNNYSIP